MKISIPSGFGERDLVSPWTMLLGDDQDVTWNSTMRFAEQMTAAERWLRKVLEGLSDVQVIEGAWDSSDVSISSPFKPDDLVDQTIFEGTTIRKPRTVPLHEFLQHPRYPVVAKDTKANEGHWKFLIKDESGLDTFVNFLRTKGFPVSQFVFQDFIQQDSHRSYVSSYRVLVGATGQIFAAALICRDKSSKASVLPDDPFSELTQPDSDWFLGGQEFCSNVAQGGRIFPLEPARQPDRPVDWEEVLKDHSIDTRRPVLPEQIEEVSKRVGRLVAPRTDLVLGVDFMTDQSGNHWYLETNSGPGLATYLYAHKRGFAQTLHLDPFKAITVEALFALGVDLRSQYPWRNKPYQF
ncbi:MAG: hypothetical protein WC777_01855 [Candidatus Gracilibacteria bacterium]|jgi:hypothetical protein